MSQASIPNITPVISITLGQTTSLLLASIALEELALAHILNAEAEKLQFVLGTLVPGLEPPATLSDILLVHSSVRQTIQDVIKKEILLQFKLENIVDNLLPQIPSS
ncbi:hypothetical protein HPY28_26910 [Brevibacillus sp. HB1.2]|uniref:hypothetical protein n=1 Tax=unclassified Brevibacillus TaxID=2684853 RepID=UPI000360CBE0|nr:MULTISPECIES: hypothetical protein [unclassified Brevibacillus]ATF16333.1 hypothetical protein A616_31570 [Brevibacillus brevis X23]NRS18716.1 hypothetical protein [Brevibacillus sp. HB1.4B]NTU23957.1 hypothetical protein [Brevibacillus sp. HB1.2]NTU33825.1 hypothetical protein [Brevibacillus sp. HB1.1]